MDKNKEIDFIDEKLLEDEIITRIKNVSKLKNINEKFIENLKNIGIHPCYSETAHFKYARIHLPVAPKCNIQCRYCKRDLNKVEYRPGVSSGIMKPQEALEHLEKCLKKIPELKIVGVAGPGDALANEETFETFELIKNKHPELHLCLATNGLLLPKYIDRLVELNVMNVTVTINTVDPKLFDKIYEFIIYNNKKYYKEEAGTILLENQLNGIKLTTEKGILIRINTVLIPEINLNQIEKISKTVSEYGAILHNIIPLIPIYQFKNHRRPTKQEMHKARELSEKYLPQFRLCKLCRADAVGIPGREKHGIKCDESPIFVRFHG